ncbi:hypothetical protein ACNQFZ_09120 [Schinkia sp. CFF1]
MHQRVRKILGLSQIIVGIVYAFGLIFGGVERIVHVWGAVSFLLGCILLVFNPTIYKGFIGRIFYFLILWFIFVIQIPPAFLWIIFNGFPITDAPDNLFKAHWGFSIIHVIMGILSINCIVTDKGK